MGFRRRRRRRRHSIFNTRIHYSSDTLGSIGERKVIAKLNPWFFGKVEHFMINNIIIKDNKGDTHQIDHIEIRHNGIFCIETKNYSGYIFGNDESEKWTQILNKKERNYFQNPVKQNEIHINQLKRVLDNKYKIINIVVMVQNNLAHIKSEFTVGLSNLKYCLKVYNDGTNYTFEEMQEIYTKIIKSASDTTNKEHVKNIKKKQQDIDDGICPRCGGKLVVREGKYGTFTGCSNYPKCTFKISGKTK